MNHDYSQQGSEPKAFWSSRYAIGLLVLGAIATYLVLSEHRAHFFGTLPLLLLACPLMHVFMHHGHGGHAGGHVHGDSGVHDSNTPAAAPTKAGERL